MHKFEYARYMGIETREKFIPNDHRSVRVRSLYGYWNQNKVLNFYSLKFEYARYMGIETKERKTVATAIKAFEYARYMGIETPET